MRSLSVQLAALALGLALAATPTRGQEHAQVRPRGRPVAVDPGKIRVMDGDTAEIHWSAADVETVRVLGVDTPELFDRREGHSRAMSPRGAEARGFARGAFAAADRVDLLRAARLDRYRRTLGYFFLDRRNYSVLVVEAGLGRETVSKYGDNGFPDEAAEVSEAARRAAARPRRGAGRPTERERRDSP